MINSVPSHPPYITGGSLGAGRSVSLARCECVKVCCFRRRHIRILQLHVLHITNRARNPEAPADVQMLNDAQLLVVVVCQLQVAEAFPDLASWCTALDSESEPRGRTVHLSARTTDRHTSR